jgi:phosphoribosylformylglycinamidine synthase subunit PurQ / glutaminase
MFKPRVCVLRSAGTNCDQETAFAFSVLGCETEFVHINKVIEGKRRFAEFHILALPGGFTYGDDIAAGKVFANELRFKLAPSLREFVSQGRLVIGICNGFQILVKSGFLPGSPLLKQEASLIINDSGAFQDRWVYLKSDGGKPIAGKAGKTEKNKPKKISSAPVRCVWTENLPEVITLPIAHGEGKFVVSDEAVLQRLKQEGRIIFRYCSAQGEIKGFNPNGSLESIAGICDSTGRILGLMPHPERYTEFSQHPRWGEERGAAPGGQQPHKNRMGDGLLILKNGVDYVRKNFV